MNKYFVIVFVAVVLVAAFAPVRAKADTIDTFVFQTCEPNCPGPSGPPPAFTNTITWQAPASPTPTSVCDFPTCFEFSITADVTVNGTDLGVEKIDFGFDHPQTGSGFEIINGNCPSSCSPIAFAGGPMPWRPGAPFGYFGPDGSPVAPGTPGAVLVPPGASPIFVPGTYQMMDSDFAIFRTGTLTITSATATPEPSVLLQSCIGLLLGFAVILFWGKQSFAAART